MKWIRFLLMLFAGGLLWVSFWVKTPLLFSLEPWVSAGILVGAMLVMCLSFREAIWMRVVLVSLAIAIIGVVVQRHVGFVQMRKEVLRETKPQTEKSPNTRVFVPLFGEHFIVGYTDPEEMRNLVRAGVGGVFVGKRNAQGKTLKVLREEIESFQRVRKEMGLPPLFIATDQEGGVVQKLSPPLPLRLALRDVTDVESYAASQAADLKSVGINVNFAPVVDLDPGKAYKGDKYTKISQRAISDDPGEVIKVAGDYVRGLKAGGVTPTLKHFPGLRLANGDTHLRPVTMDVVVDGLRQRDWLPFNMLLSSDVWLMMSHVTVPGLGDMPVSYSPQALYMIRNDWNFDGMIVTDDWSMGAIYNSPQGVSGAAVQALNNGTDIILVAYDPDVYFETMAALLVADKKGQINKEELQKSEQRIELKRLENI